jgi:uncharacterized glyoxalase superfamily protein PhnB
MVATVRANHDITCHEGAINLMAMAVKGGPFMAITPYLLCRDAGAAVDWLVAAFGLSRTGDVFKGDDGRVTHAALQFGKALLMLGSPGPDFKGPRALGHATQNLYVDVDDVEEHYARAVKAGATIIEEPKDTFYGARRYGAEDLEGHRWYFAQELTPARTATKKAPRRKAASKRKANGRKRRPRK